MKNVWVKKILVSIFISILIATIALMFISKPPVWLIFSVIFSSFWLTITVLRHSYNTKYLCPACRHVFRISPLSDFFSPQSPEKKLLKCRKCNTTDWCKVFDG